MTTPSKAAIEAAVDEICIRWVPGLIPDSEYKRFRNEVRSIITNALAPERQRREELLKLAIHEIQELKDEIMSYHIDWAKWNRESPDYDPNYKPQYPTIVSDVNETITAIEAELKKE